MGVSLRRRRSGKKDVIPTDPQQQQSSVPISHEHGTSSSRSSRSTRGRSLTRSVSARVSRSLSRSRAGSVGPRSRSPRRRPSFSLSRRRSRSRSSSSSSSRAADADAGDDDVNADVRVMSSIGLTDMIDDDFLFEDSLHYDPAKHGLRDSGTWGCDPATACGRDGRRNGGEGGGGGGEGGATLGVLMAKCLRDSEDACVSFCHGLGACGPPSQDKRSGRNRSSRRGRCCGGEGMDGNSTLASFSSLESKTLATNTVPLKKKESKLAAYLRRRSKSPAKNRKQSNTRDGGSRRRRSLSRGRSRSGRDDGDRRKGSAAVAFNPYGDDGIPTTNTTLSPRRSKSKERQKAKWKLSKGKKKNSGNDSVKSPQFADVSDWRSVRDDVLSHCEQGHFITYEAGRVRSSTKKGGNGGDSDAFERFLYL